MERQALGLIETVGLIGAIEAADAAVKAAAVTLVKSEVTQGALVTIHIEGELGAVQAAVEAGASACQRVGRLLTKTVIPRPDPGLDAILGAASNIAGGADGPYCAVVEPPRGGTTPPRSRRAPRRTSSHLAGSTDYESMTVAALRRLARRRGDLSIGGRDIARADKDLLVRMLREADAGQEQS